MSSTQHPSSPPPGPPEFTTARRLLVVHPQPLRRKQLAQILRSVCPPVEVWPTLEHRESLHGYALVLVDYDALEAAERAVLLRLHGDANFSGRLLVVSAGACRQDFVRLFSGRVLTNLISSHEPFLGEELVVTVRKLLRGDIFGLEKYFPMGTHLQVMRVRQSSDKAAAIDGAREFAQQLGVHPRLAIQFSSVMDEFISNAVYNAPVGADGVPRFAHYPRERGVSLEPGEDIVVRMASDGRRLGLSTQDPFGSLRECKILESLARCYRGGEDQIENKEGGAGLGFFHILEQLSHFAVNLEPGAKTEMIGLLDVRGSFRDFASSGKSFNLFTHTEASGSPLGA